ncbi:hypothetical protein E2C01_042297 [Portunus trituberculatus]|uniref:Uncharacterized protein n=1 Tax=Portunus trituberculatus TaxID=210409 RepID=A0A5B7FU87_PORTR|nr:hypothetical protein [Portunus trituberculatus]
MKYSVYEYSIFTIVGIVNFFIYICLSVHVRGAACWGVEHCGGEGRLPGEQVPVAWVVEELCGELLEEVLVAGLKSGARMLVGTPLSGAKQFLFFLE